MAPGTVSRVCCTHSWLRHLYTEMPKATQACVCALACSSYSPAMQETVTAPLLLHAPAFRGLLSRLLGQMMLHLCLAIYVCKPITELLVQP